MRPNESRRYLPRTNVILINSRSKKTSPATHVFIAAVIRFGSRSGSVVNEMPAGYTARSCTCVKGLVECATLGGRITPDFVSISEQEFPSEAASRSRDASNVVERRNSNSGTINAQFHGPFWEHIKPGMCIVLHITEEPRDKFLT